jgi:hypothetical protein
VRAPGDGRRRAEGFLYLGVVLDLARGGWSAGRCATRSKLISRSTNRFCFGRSLGSCYTRLGVFAALDSAAIVIESLCT